VGIATLTGVALRIIHDTVEGFMVVRIGWTKLGELGFWRAIPVAARTPRWDRDNGGAPAGFG
jgi:hypothetical protein